MIGIFSVFSISVFPIYLIFATLFSMNIFELLIINLLILYLIKLINTNNYNNWYFIGLLAGIGLMNKHTAILYLLALFIGILISNKRNILFNKQFLFSIIFSSIIIMPNIVWQTWKVSKPSTSSQTFLPYFRFWGNWADAEIFYWEGRS